VRASLAFIKPVVMAGRTALFHGHSLRKKRFGYTTGKSEKRIATKRLAYRR
jgi:hypothetical protein